MILCSLVFPDVLRVSCGNSEGDEEEEEEEEEKEKEDLLRPLHLIFNLFDFFRDTHFGGGLEELLREEE
jgi:hypothetical protein